MNAVSGATILVIEDNAAVRQGIATYLEGRDFRALEAENGRVGLEVFRTRRPDLVLVDLRMPEVDGLEVLATLTGESPDTPVIVVSGTGAIADAVEALHLGAWDYLLKPIADPAVLFHAVEKSLERARLIRRDREYQQHLEKKVRLRTAELEEANQALRREMAERELVEAELRNNERKFRLLYEETPLGYQSLDAEGRFIEVNRAWLEMLGYRRDEVIGRSFGDFVARHQVELFRQRFPRFKARGETHGAKFEMVRKDGSRVLVSIDGRVGRDEQGNFRQTHCVLHDVTEQIAAEEALRESEERFRSLSNASFEGIAITERGRFVDANTAFERMFGHEIAELAGKEVLSVVAPEDREMVAARIRSEYEDPYEHRALRKDGSRIEIEVCGKTMHYKGRRCRISAVRDITDRRRAEKALRESEAKNRAILEAIPDIMFRLSRDGTHLDFHTPSAQDLYALPENIVGKTAGELLPAEVARQYIESIDRTIANQAMEVFEYQLEFSEDDKRYYEARMVPCGDDSVLSIVRNITQRRGALDKLRQMETHLAHVTRLSAMGEMVAGIAHEVNQPFYSILNFAKASRNVLSAQREPNLEDLRDWMNEIAAAAARAGDIIRRLRDFARKTGSIRVVSDIEGIIGESIELVAFEARQRHVTVQRERCKAALAASVDRVEIQQVLVNLLRNACEALEESEVPRRLVTIRTAATDAFVEVSVADNGPGLPPDKDLTIFNAFATTKIEGLGMGLAISKSIVESHGGEIWAASNPDGGATFHFTLPLVREGHVGVQ